MLFVVSAVVSYLDTSYLPYLFAKIPSDVIKPGYVPFNLYLPLLSQRGFSSSPVGGMLQSQVAAWRHFRDYRQVGSLCVEAKDVRLYTLLVVFNAYAFTYFHFRFYFRLYFIFVCI